MKKLNKTKMLKPVLLMMAAVLVLIVGMIVFSRKESGPPGNAYYRCVLGVSPGPGYARCAVISGPKTCYPAYKLLGSAKNASIDVSGNHDGATCEGFEPDKVNYYDQQGRFIETKSYSGEL